MKESEKKVNAIGIVSPHAGYIYSGPVAGSVFSRIKPRSTYIILGPNHTGYGKQFSIMSRGFWDMPHGEVEIDSDLAGGLLKNSKILQEDEVAHRHEHLVQFSKCGGRLLRHHHR